MVSGDTHAYRYFRCVLYTRLLPAAPRKESVAVCLAPAVLFFVRQRKEGNEGKLQCSETRSFLYLETARKNPGPQQQ